MNAKKLLLSILAITLILAILTACAPAATPTPEVIQPTQVPLEEKYKGQTIRALAFEGYTDESLVKDFEDKYGVTIEEVYVYSNEDIFSNLKAGGGSTFDLVTPTSDIWPMLIDQGLVQPMDTSKLTNYQDLTKTMRELAGTSKDGKIYGVPFSWGADVVVYNKDVFTTPPDSYSVLFDEQYKQKIVGWDNAATLAITGLYMGYKKPFTTEPTQLAAVKAKLCEQYPLIRIYAAQISDYQNVFQSGDGVVGVSGGTEVVTALKTAGVTNFEWTIPKEGTLAWVDGLFIPTGAKNIELVQLLIDHLIAPKAQSQLHMNQGYGLSNPKAYDLLPADKVEQLKRQDPGNNTDKRFEPWSPVEDYDLWIQTWNEIKAGCQ
jgi:spermidine/putrescine-binding protein